MDEFLKLTIALIVVVVFVLVGVLMYLTYKEKKQKEDGKNNNVNDEIDEKKAQRSVFQFMEFDTVEDNMIVEDNGKKYLMVIECKGINYDLLSNVEKTSIEEGFIGFLNALKFEIQLYIQTRKVNLMQSTSKYRERLRAIELDMRQEEQRYADMQRAGGYSRQELLKEIKEVTKKRNLYEYARDVIENTEQMSEDSDLTTKEYYIVVPYYTEEITSVGDYDKREISSMAFSELYTRAQSIVSTLMECDVRGRILNSQELVELLFISYNREQHDLYDFDEYMSNSGFDSFYSKTSDVLQKRMIALDEEIVRKGNERAVEAYRRANDKFAKKRKEIDEREKRMKEYISNYAKNEVRNRTNVIGENIARETLNELDLMDEEDENKKKLKNEKENKNTETKSEETDLKVEKLKTKKRELTEEEKRIRRAKILKRRKLLKEREAMKNGENQDNE